MYYSLPVSSLSLCPPSFLLLSFTQRISFQKIILSLYVKLRVVKNGFTITITSLYFTFFLIVHLSLDYLNMYTHSVYRHTHTHTYTHTHIYYVLYDVCIMLLWHSKTLLIVSVFSFIRLLSSPVCSRRNPDLPLPTQSPWPRYWDQWTPGSFNNSSFIPLHVSRRVTV